tara:strand:- start:435 stop:1709 length:1275 start_codon:yes stop_codon:yes gene_type:complete
MINLLKKIFSTSKNSNNKDISFDTLKKNKSLSLLFLAIENYSEKSEIRYVGGCIRKILNKEKIDDIDFAVNLEPYQCIEAFKKNNIKYLETGIEHGTITAIIDNNKFEITSLRKDISTDGRHAKVKFSNSWFEDSSRRDFTINSIYADVDGNLYDPFNGKKDLEIGHVKFIGDAEKRIKEDYLRILRYIRFFLNYSKIDHDENVKKIIKQNINGISNISSERLLDEFKKIIQSKNFLRLFEDSFCEEIIKLVFTQFKHFDRFKKLNKFVKLKFSDVDYIFLISLMIIDETDNVNYFLYKFNLSNVDKRRILFLKKFYIDKKDNNFFSEKNLWKILYYNGKQTLKDILYFEIFKSKKINKKLISLYNFFEKKEVPIFPIKAKNIMEKYNLSEGKLLGVKLKKIEEKWIDNNFRVSEKEVAQLINN